MRIAGLGSGGEAHSMQDFLHTPVALGGYGLAIVGERPIIVGEG